MACSGYFCLVKSWMMLCSDTWEPRAERHLRSFSVWLSIFWSSWLVKPSTPDRGPEKAASSVDTWRSHRASSTSAFVAKGCSCILLRALAMRTMASSCLAVMGMLEWRSLSLSRCRALLHVMICRFLSFSAASTDSRGPNFAHTCSSFKTKFIYYFSVKLFLTLFALGRIDSFSFVVSCIV